MPCDFVSDGLYYYVYTTMCESIKTQDVQADQFDLLLPTDCDVWHPTVDVTLNQPLKDIKDEIDRAAWILKRGGCPSTV